MSYLLNGKILNNEELQLAVDKNGAFWYGDGFFESMKYVNGRILFVEQHWERILLSCSILKMKNPFNDISNFIHDVNLLAHINSHPSQRIKLVIWRNTWQAYLPESESVEYLITSIKQEDLYYPLNYNGLKLGIYTENLKSFSKLGNVKSTSSQLYVLATLFTQSKKFDDSIILNSRRNLVETSRSNLWICINNTLYTPPLNEGCLDGIMRRVILEICNEHNIMVQQEVLTLEMLNGSSEVFTTSAIRGIQWVTTVEEQQYPANHWATKLSTLLNEKAYTYNE